VSSDNYCNKCETWYDPRGGEHVCDFSGRISALESQVAALESKLEALENRLEMIEPKSS
jgi:ubiquinone biosynthesis protein UbiJ